MKFVKSSFYSKVKPLKKLSMGKAFWVLQQENTIMFDDIGSKFSHEPTEWTKGKT